MNGTIKIFITVSVITIAVFGGVVFLYLEIGDVSAQVSEVTRKTKRAQEENKRHQSIHEIFTNNRQEIRKLSTYFVPPEAVGTSEFLDRLERLGEITGVQTTTKSVEQAGGDDTFPELQLTLQAQGQWHEIYHLLALVETMPFKIDIKNAQLSSGGEQWSLTLDISTIKQIDTS